MAILPSFSSFAHIMFVIPILQEWKRFMKLIMPFLIVCYCFLANLYMCYERNEMSLR